MIRIRKKRLNYFSKELKTQCNILCVVFIPAYLILTQKTYQFRIESLLMVFIFSFRLFDKYFFPSFLFFFLPYLFGNLHTLLVLLGTVLRFTLLLSLLIFKIRSNHFEQRRNLKYGFLRWTRSKYGSVVWIQVNLLQIYLDIMRISNNRQSFLREVIWPNFCHFRLILVR